MLGLGILYLFAVLPVAVLYGLGWALAVSIASMLAFNYFFLPPLAHTLALSRFRELGRARGLRRYRRGRERARHTGQAEGLRRSRGGRPAPERRRQDGDPARGQPRPPLAADGDPRGRRAASERVARARR